MLKLLLQTKLHDLKAPPIVVSNKTSLRFLCFYSFILLLAWNYTIGNMSPASMHSERQFYVLINSVLFYYQCSSGKWCRNHIQDWNSIHIDHSGGKKKKKVWIIKLFIFLCCALWCSMSRCLQRRTRRKAVKASMCFTVTSYSILI